QAMMKADVVIHNAAWNEFGISQTAQDRMRMINVQGTKNTLGLAVELGVSKIIYVSTILVFGDTGEVIADETFQRVAPFKSCYVQTKTEAHEHALQLQQGGAPIVIACPAGVIGTGDHSGVGYLIRMYVRGWLPPIIFAANGWQAHIHADDAAEGIARCVERGKVGESYILSNGIMRHRDMINLWKQTPGGMKLTLFYMPDSLGMLFNIIAEPIERLFGLPIVFCREFAIASFAKWKFSAAKADRELGIQFRSVEQEFLDTLEAERAIANKKKF
ncbi:MAG: NAD-dependent epimerase/dehydratase family protein, partial [Anaerolineales bacterium]